MDWAASEWKQDLPQLALQNVNSLEERLEKFQKECQQKQFKIESLEVTLCNQKLKVEEEKQQNVTSKRELQVACDNLKEFEDKYRKLQNELQNRDAQINSLEGQLSHLKKQTLKLEQLETTIDELKLLNQSAKQENQELENKLSIEVNVASQKNNVILSLQEKLSNLQLTIATNKEPESSCKEENIANGSSSVTDENNCLKQKIIEQENLIQELRSKIPIATSSQSNDQFTTPAKNNNDRNTSSRLTSSAQKSFGLWSETSSTPSQYGRRRGCNSETFSFSVNAEGDDKVKGLEHQLKQMRNELDCHRHNSEAVKKSAEQKYKESESILKADIKHQSQVIADLEKELKETKTKYQQESTQANKKIDFVTAQLNKVEASKKEFEKEIKTLNEKNDSNNALLNQLEKSSQDKEKDSLSLTKKFEEVKTVNMQLESQILSLDKTIIEMNTQNEELKAQCVAKHLLESDIVKLQEERNEQNNQLSLLKEENNNYQQVLKSLKVSMDELKMEEERLNALKDAQNSVIKDSELKISNLNKAITETNTQNVELKGLIKEKFVAKYLLEELQKERDEQNNQLYFLKEKNNGYLQELGSIKTAMDELKTEKEKLKALKDEHKSLIKDSESKISSLDKTIIEMNTQNEELKAEINEKFVAKHLLEELQKEKNDQNILLGLLTEEHNGCRQELMCVKTAMDELKTEKEKLNVLNNELSSIIKDSELKISSLIETIDEMSSQNEELNAQIKEKCVSKHLFEELQKERDEQNNQLRFLKEESDGCQQELMGLKTAMDVLKTEKEKLKALNDKHNSLIKDSESKISSLDKTIIEMNTQNEELKAEINEKFVAKHLLEELQKEKNEQNIQLCLLNEKNNGCQQELMCVKTAMDELKAEKEKLNVLNDELSSIIKDSESKIANLDKTIVEMNTQIGELKAENDKKFTAKHLIEELQKERDEQNDQLCSLKEENHGFQQELRSVKTALDELKPEKEKLKALNDDLSSIIKDSESKISSLDKTIIEMKTHNEEMKAQINEKCVAKHLLESDLVKLQIERDDKNNQLCLLEEKNNGYLQELESIKTAMDELKTENDKLNALNDEHNSVIKDTKEKISELDKLLTERTIENEMLAVQLKDKCMAKELLESDIEKLNQKKIEIENQLCLTKDQNQKLKLDLENNQLAILNFQLELEPKFQILEAKYDALKNESEIKLEKLVGTVDDVEELFETLRKKCKEQDIVEESLHEEIEGLKIERKLISDDVILLRTINDEVQFSIEKFKIQIEDLLLQNNKAKDVFKYTFACNEVLKKTVIFIQQEMNNLKMLIQQAESLKWKENISSQEALLSHLENIINMLNVEAEKQKLLQEKYKPLGLNEIELQDFEAESGKLDLKHMCPICKEFELNDIALKGKLLTLESKLENVEKSLIEKCKEIESLQAHLENELVLKEKLQALESMLENVQKNLTDKCEELVSLQCHQESICNEYELNELASKEKLQTLESKFKKVEKSLTEKCQELENLQVHKESICADYELHEKRSSEMLKDLESKLESLEKNLCEKCTELETLQARQESISKECELVELASKEKVQALEFKLENAEKNFTEKCKEFESLQEQVSICKKCEVNEIALNEKFQTFASNLEIAEKSLMEKCQELKNLQVHQESISKEYQLIELSLKEELQALKSKLENVEKHLIEKCDELENLKECEKNFSWALEKNESNSKEIIENLEFQLEIAKKNLTEKCQELEDLQLHHESVSKEYQLNELASKEKVQTLESKLENIENSLTQTRKEVESLQAHREEALALKEKLQTLESKLENVENNLTEKHKELENLQVHQESISKEYQLSELSLKEELQTLESRLENVNMCLREKCEEMEFLQELQEIKCKEYELNKTTLLEKLQTSESKLEHAEKSLAEKCKELECLQAHTESTSKEYEINKLILKEKIISLEANLKNSQELKGLQSHQQLNVDNVTDEANENRLKIKSAEKAINELNNKLESLKKANGLLNDTIEGIEQDLEEAFQKNQSFEDQIAKLNSENSDLQNQILELNVKIIFNEGKNTDLESKLEEQMSPLKKLTERNNIIFKESESYKNRVKELKAENLKLQEELENYRLSIDSNNSTVFQLEQEICDLKIQNSEICETKEEMSKLQSKVLQLELKVSDITNQKTEIEGKKLNQESVLQDKIQENANLLKDIEKYKDEVAELEIKNSYLQNETLHFDTRLLEAERINIELDTKLTDQEHIVQELKIANNDVLKEIEWYKIEIKKLEVEIQNFNQKLSCAKIEKSELESKLSLLQEQVKKHDEDNLVEKLNAKISDLQTEVEERKIKILNLLNEIEGIKEEVQNLNVQKKELLMEVEKNVKAMEDICFEKNQILVENSKLQNKVMLLNKNLSDIESQKTKLELELANVSDLKNTLKENDVIISKLKQTISNFESQKVEWDNTLRNNSELQGEIKLLTKKICDMECKKLSVDKDNDTLKKDLKKLRSDLSSMYIEKELAMNKISELGKSELQLNEKNLHTYKSNISPSPENNQMKENEILKHKVSKLKFQLKEEESRFKQVSDILSCCKDINLNIISVLLNISNCVSDDESELEELMLKLKSLQNFWQEETSSFEASLIMQKAEVQFVQAYFLKKIKEKQDVEQKILSFGKNIQEEIEEINKICHFNHCKEIEESKMTSPEAIENVDYSCIFAAYDSPPDETKVLNKEHSRAILQELELWVKSFRHLSSNLKLFLGKKEEENETLKNKVEKMREDVAAELQKSYRDKFNLINFNYQRLTRRHQDLQTRYAKLEEGKCDLSTTEMQEKLKCAEQKLEEKELELRDTWVNLGKTSRELRQLKKRCERLEGYLKQLQNHTYQSDSANNQEFIDVGLNRKTTACSDTKENEEIQPSLFSKVQGEMVKPTHVQRHSHVIPPDVLKLQFESSKKNRPV